MSKREKILAAGVGILFVLGIVVYLGKSVSDARRTRRATIDRLESEVRKKQSDVMFGQLTADRMTVYERRSLPRDPEEARSQYQTWLLKLVTETGFEDANVTATTTRPMSDVYQLISFTISGRSDLKQLVEFKHQFYATDCLHRIRRLYVKRLPETRRMDVSMSIDAVAINTAPETKDLEEKTLERLPHGDLAAYLDIILGRNVSGPPNQPPRLEVADEEDGYANEPFVFVARAQDSDDWDSLRYFIEHDGGLYDAEIDEQSGEFRWTPKEPGEYEVVIGVADDGWPSKSVSQSVKLNVTERPQEAEAPMEKPKPSFALARFVFVTATTSANGHWQAWISLRTEGRTMLLSEGDEFEVGEVTVRITRITQDEVEMEAEALERRFLVTAGQNLSEGVDI
jgi:hypothetical protein